MVNLQGVLISPTMQVILTDFVLPGVFNQVYRMNEEPSYLQSSNLIELAESYRSDVFQ